jgi:hypothetical protein
MFRWLLKRTRKSPAGARRVCQPPGEVFPWPKGWRITAIDEAMIAIPTAIIGDDEVVGTVIHGDDDIQIDLHEWGLPNGRFIIWLKPGQSCSISKSCQAIVVPRNEGDTAIPSFWVADTEFIRFPTA